MTLVVAHRGASAAHPPGNTPESLAASALLGADWVELDVHSTADGALAVHHDPDLSDGRAISALLGADLPPSVPQLAAALGLCAPLGVNVEIKPDGPDALRPDLIDSVVSLLHPLEADQQFLVTSFDQSIIDEVRRRTVTIATGLLTMGEVRSDDDLRRLVDLGHVAINPWHAAVDAELVDRAKGLGLAVNVWTVDDPDRMRTLIGFGVDAIITNVPDVCRAVVDAS